MQIQRPESSDPKTNHFLAKLERDDYDALVRKGKIVGLKLNKRLIQQDAEVGAVYFPLTSMLSLLVTSNGQPQMEMATMVKKASAEHWRFSKNKEQSG